MQMKASQTVPASRDKVWAALNDPDCAEAMTVSRLPRYRDMDIADRDDGDIR